MSFYILYTKSFRTFFWVEFSARKEQRGAFYIVVPSYCVIRTRPKECMGSRSIESKGWCVLVSIQVLPKYS